MSQDSEKRFRSIMDKLFHSSKSSSNNHDKRFINHPHIHIHFHICVCSPNNVFRFCSSSGVQLSSSRGKKRGFQSIVDRRGDEQYSSATAVSESQGHLCRPWDRADFMRRLATFKSISWFAKPKVIPDSISSEIRFFFVCYTLFLHFCLAQTTA